MAWPEHHSPPGPVVIRSIRRCGICKVVQASEREPDQAELCDADCKYNRTWQRAARSWIIPVPNHKAVLAAFLLFGWDGIKEMVEGVHGWSD